MIYQTVGQPLALPLSALELSTRIFGPRCIDLRPWPPVADAVFMRGPTRPNIVRISRNALPELQSIALGRAIARWGIATWPRVETDPETAAHAILMPAPAVAICVAILGMNADEMAEMFRVPPWAAAYRIRRVMMLRRSGEYRIVR